MTAAWILRWLLENWKAALAGAVVAASVAFGGAMYLRARAADASAAEARMDAVNAEAAADSTRRVWTGVIAANRSYWVRQIVQVRLERDSLDRALDSRPRVRADVGVTVAGVDTVVVADTVVVDTADVRRATFRARREPFTVAAAVALPPPGPLSPTLNLSIALDTLDMGVRIGCGPPGPQGVRRATFGAELPWWATPRVRSVEQEPGVCNPEAVDGPGWWERNDQWVAAVGGTLLGVWAADRVGIRWPF